MGRKPAKNPLVRRRMVRLTSAMDRRLRAAVRKSGKGRGDIMREALDLYLAVFEEPASSGATKLPHAQVSYTVARTLPESRVFEPMLQWHSPRNATADEAREEANSYPSKYGVDPIVAKVTIIWQKVEKRRA